MTLDDLRRLPMNTLTPAQVAPLLGVKEHAIRIQARSDASKLGFPVIVIGNRTKIPRLPFIRFMTGEEAKNDQ